MNTVDNNVVIKSQYECFRCLYFIRSILLTDEGISNGESKRAYSKYYSLQASSLFIEMLSYNHAYMDTISQVLIAAFSWRKGVYELERTKSKRLAYEMG